MRKLIGALLLAAGTLALVYGGFSYTRKNREVRLGPVSLNVKKQERVNVPVWVGVAAIAAGGGLLLLPRRR